MKRILTVLIILLFLPLLASGQGNIGISLQGGMALPRGDFDEFYKLGYAGTGSLFFEISPRFELSFTSGFLKWNADVEEDDVTLASTPILIGLRYYIPVGDYIPYATLEGGLHFLTSEGFDIETNYDDFGYGVGAGLLYRVWGDMYFDLGVKYNSIFDSRVDDYTSDFLTIILGVRIALM